MRLRHVLVVLVFGLALAQACTMTLAWSGGILHRSAYEAAEERLGPLDPVRFLFAAQTPHPLLDVAATRQLPQDEINLLHDWVDKIPTSVLDEFLTFSVIEEGTLTDRCAETRRVLDWAIEQTHGSFGIEYTDYESEFPPGFSNLKSLDRMIFLCGWSALRDGDALSAQADIDRLGGLASIEYEEPSIWNLEQAWHAEANQHQLLHRLLASGSISSEGAQALRASLPKADLHQGFVTAMSVEATMAESRIDFVRKRVLKENDGDSPVKRWLKNMAEKAALEHMAAGYYSAILRFIDSYDDSYHEMQTQLILSEDSHNLARLIRDQLAPDDWRYVAKPRWTEDHRRLADAMLTVIAAGPDTNGCTELQAALGDLNQRFEVVEEDNGCRVHYAYGEDYLWPSKERVVDNPTGDWWLPASH